ncbi:MAG TPA: DUF4440 domain-containing protein [Vicinamibacterales bacterium]|nr:DUF4440 domain-containing protein [Vicinamibacterales bacterium]
MKALWIALLLVVPAAAPASEIRVEWSEAIGTECEIAAVRRAYVAAANEGPAGLAVFYQPDALAIFDASGFVSGVEGIREHLTRAASSSRIVSVTFTPRTFAVEGALGSESGSFVEVTESAGGRTEVEGLYVIIYSRRGDGRWRIAMELRTRSGVSDDPINRVTDNRGIWSSHDRIIEPSLIA